MAVFSNENSLLHPFWFVNYIIANFVKQCGDRPADGYSLRAAGLKNPTRDR
jgi:hypothetical protein